jgi:tRNA threonylcarbamoyladenosine biosynthesis protein TsaB
MSIILNIDTAQETAFVCISENGKPKFVAENHSQNDHASFLHPAINELLKKAAISITELDAIAVTKGPGSYTGLRVGMSAAKGLAYTLQKPLLTISTLELMAHDILTIIVDKESLICPMIDARRMEVYSAIFNSKLEKIREVKAEIITEESFLENIETIHFVGDCSEKAKTVLTNQNFIFHDEMVYPSAKEMSFLSFKKFQEKDFEDVAYFEPYYLKDFMITVSKK